MGCNIAYKWCLKLEKKATNNKKKRFENLIIWVMIYWLLTFMQMALFYSPVLIVEGLNSIFEQNSPPISLYRFPLLREFDLKKASPPFKEFDKFL